MSKLMIKTALLVLAVGVGAGRAQLTPLTHAAHRQDAKKEAKSDRDRLQGTWIMILAVENGRETEKPEGHKISFKGDRFTIAAGAEMKGDFKLDPSTQPKVIDLKMTEGPEKGQMVEGIYKFEGDDLKICFARPGTTDRPTEFVSRETMKRVLLVLRREK